jgi:endoglucanase
MAEEYADADHVLYEICNEPNGGTGWGEIKSYAEEVIGVIRSHDEDGVILVGTPNWSQFVDEAAADPITGYGNLMYTLHFYAATHKEELRGRMEAAVDAGLPVFVSEYGICDASGSGAIDEEQAGLWMELLKERGVSCVAWNLSNKDETSAILLPSCGKTSGFEESDLSAAGNWLYRMLTGEGEPEGSGEKAGGQAQEPGGKNGGGSETQETEALTNGGMEIQALVKNSWESEGKTVYQYELVLKNTSGKDMDGWR